MAAATLHLEIVTPEKLAYSAEVESVVIPAVEGEIGVLPQHITLMTQIKAGELVISKGGQKEYLAVGEGFATVTRPVAGTYCLNLTDASINPATLAPMVGVEWGNSTGFSLNAYASIDAYGCPAGTDMGVKTYEWTSTTESAQSNEVAFTILVP